MTNHFSKFLLCIVIPFYNHGRRLHKVVEAVLEKKIPCIVVDDGSTDPESIQALSELPGDCILVKNPLNSGKGAALKNGFQAAYSRGFTHALTLDADGQHCASDIETFLTESHEYPDSIVLGKPQFDSSAPWERVWGRKLSTWLVWLQTRSIAVQDILCGFRVYPLARILPLLQQVQSPRMGFDIEIVVRFLWAGGTARNIKTQVIYPEDGLSHFHYLRDNSELARLHISLLLRSLIPGKKRQEWFEEKERGSAFGLKILLAVYAILGRRVLTALLSLVSFFYLLFAHSARQASFEYHRHLKNKGAQVRNKWLHAYMTFFYFAKSSLDAVRAWKGDVLLSDAQFINLEIPHEYLSRNVGAVVFTAHFGPIEASRALHRQRKGFKVYALMFLKHAMKFRGMIESISPGAHADVLPVETLTIASLTNLQEKIESGAFLGIMADRLSPQSTERFVEHEFLGETARFPEGPFLLAATLRMPVLAVTASYRKTAKEFAIEWRQFSIDHDAPRKEKIDSLVKQYVELLEENCMRGPEHFFNFYGYWGRGES